MESTATRLWKRLTSEERQRAAAAFWREPPQELVGSALGAIVKARHLRPQVARSLPPEAQARALASVLDPAEPLSAALLVALHLGERRRMLSTFLEALGLAHEDGILKDGPESPGPVPQEAAREAVRALAAAFPRHEVETYLNTLWLQDPDRWGALAESSAWL